MAQIKVTAYLNTIKKIDGVGGTSTLFEVGERHSKKNPQTGAWEQDGTNTYFDVWVDRAGADLSQFVEGDLINIEGSFRTKKTEKPDGKVYYNNVINATALSKFQKRDNFAQSLAALGAVEVDPDAPF